MSTPDKTSSTAPERPPVNGGANAYKVNRSGLVAPRPWDAPARAPGAVAPVPVAAPVAAPARAGGPGAWLLALAAAVALAGLWLAVNSRSGRPAAAPDAAAVPPDAAAPAGAVAALPSYRALVIGINRYEQGAGEHWQPLQSARADAEAVSRALADEYGFHVQTLLDGEATRAAILNALDEMATSGADGADLIYFAGHGFYDDKLQEGYWIPSDARRRVDGREAKEDWIWNSTITRLINASRARHVLVMSDACYSGSLFRGDEPLSARTSQAWYERAIAKPSRYLITSGGIEPVLDSGAGHSVFAHQVLNYLVHSDRHVFSANDLGLALRERVAALTGQMVQMGPLPVSGHAGGEFVFLRQRSGRALAALNPQPRAAAGEPGELRGTGPEAEAQARQAAIRDAVALTRDGAPKAANGLVSALLQQNAQDQLARAVSGYIARSQGQEGRDELRRLIEAVEAKAGAVRPDGAAAPSARPRVLACLGPALPAAGTPAAEAAALLYRIALRSELEARAGIKVIEREALETLLQEQNLGVSGLADPRARLAIGKLLPASLLLLGDLVPSGASEKLFLRLVDTETTQVLASFTASRQANEEPEAVCAALAARIAERVVALKPLLAPVVRADGARLRAELGAFQGVRAGAAFDVLERVPRDKKVPDDVDERAVGTATVASVSDYACELDAVWGAGPPARPQDLWVRERPPPGAAQP